MRILPPPPSTLSEDASERALVAMAKLLDNMRHAGANFYDMMLTVTQALVLIDDLPAELDASPAARLELCDDIAACSCFVCREFSDNDGYEHDDDGDDDE